jgi:hypothetical protein
LKDALRIAYDAEVDILRIVSRAASIAENDEDGPGVILDTTRSSLSKFWRLRSAWLTRAPWSWSRRLIGVP